MGEEGEAIFIEDVNGFCRERLKADELDSPMFPASCLKNGREEKGEKESEKENSFWSNADAAANEHVNVGV